MPDFQYFLLTRINVDGWFNRPRTKEERNTKDFLDHRFSIFEKTCYPSVQSQTKTNFIWLVLCDDMLPEAYRQRLETYNSIVKIIPIYITSKDTLLETVYQVIISNFTNTTKYLITTNLDSDDIIAKNFIATVLQKFNQQSFEFINFPFGYLYNLNTRVLFLREWHTASCHTLIEKIQKNNKFDTALKYSHIDINKYNLRQVIMKPMWLMTVHGKNDRTAFDVNAAWQPIFRLEERFMDNIDYPQMSFCMILRGCLLQ
ncbi:MAG TPA: glycosyltransferase [Xenococcaceae cyanobacterium]